MRRVLFGVLIGIMSLGEVVSISQAATPNLQLIEQQVKKTVEERQQQPRPSVSPPSSPTPENNGDFFSSFITPVSPSPTPTWANEVVLPDKIFWSFLGGRVKLHRRNGQVYFGIYL